MADEPTLTQPVPGEVPNLADHLDAIFDHAPFGLAQLTATGRFVRSNHALQVLLGRTAEQLFPLGFAELTHPDDTAGDVAAFQRMAAGEIRIYQREKRYRHAQGHFVWIWLTAIGLYDPLTGAFRGTLSYVVDINARKEAELALRQSVETTAKLRAQEALLAELSTPLIPISDQVMVMPLIGAIDARRAEQVIVTLLDGVAQAGTQTAIIDITGVRQINREVADMLIRAARAVRLLGAQVILTGIRAEIAQILVSLGIDMSDLVTRSTLQSGIAYALQHGARTERSPPAR